MTGGADWSAFYLALCSVGSRAIAGLAEDDRELIDTIAGSTDGFWSGELQATFEDAAADSGVRAAVLAALEVWLRSVRSALRTDFGVGLSGSPKVDPRSPAIDELIAAAGGDPDGMEGAVDTR